MFARSFASATAASSPPSASTSPRSLACCPVQTRPCATASNFLRRRLAGFGHLLDEVVVEALHVFLQLRALRRCERRERRIDVGVGAGLHGFPRRRRSCPACRRSRTSADRCQSIRSAWPAAPRSRAPASRCSTRPTPRDPTSRRRAAVTGSLRASTISSRQITSEATDEPPGLSIRSTIALIVSSSLTRRICSTMVSDPTTEPLIGS